MNSLSFTYFFFNTGNRTQYRLLNAQWQNPCVKQAVLGSIPGGYQIFLILYCCFLKACKKERIHLTSKRRFRKKLWSDKNKILSDVRYVSVFLLCLSYLCIIAQLPLLLGLINYIIGERDTIRGNSIENQGYLFKYVWTYVCHFGTLTLAFLH